MGFLGEPFKHDLFVSYSHGDFDGTGRSHLKTWSQAFVRELEAELRQHPKFGRLGIFLDQDQRPEQGLDPTRPLTQQLRDEIGTAGVLTILMSPHYLLSKWCGDERDWWVQCQAQRGLAPDGRITIARIWPTEDPWPTPFVDERREPLVGFTFYDLARAAVRPQPYGWPDPTDAKGPFRDALLDMVGVIWKRLESLKAELDDRERRKDEAARLAAADGQVIYLHARAEHAEAWERAAGVLEQKGFVVWPGEPDPVEQDPRRAREIAERRVETLSGCDGLLLLGTDDGRALDADLIVVGRQDRHAARARSERLLPCAVLDTAGPVLPIQRRRTMAHRLGIDWIETAHDVWPVEVHSWLIEASGALARV